jgi:hypothetical protein
MSGCRCVRCGVNQDEDSSCVHCGEDAVIDVDSAYDLLNELYLLTNNGDSFEEWIIRINNGDIT